MKEVSKFVVLSIVFYSVVGCASKKYVQEQIQTESAAIHTRIDSVEGQIEENQIKLKEHEKQIMELSSTAQEALKRATEAGKLAKGKLLYEIVLSEDKVRFGFGEAELSEEAKAAIDEIIGPIVAQNRNVYFEIQGHTDSTGSEEYNYRLGLKRAEAVRRYLNLRYRIPLHRISVISYGETVPIADNSTPEGRAKNRRVVILVLE